MTSITSIADWIGHNLLFSDYLESDQRTPIVTFSIPQSLLPGSLEGSEATSLGLLAPSIEFWIALAMCLLIGSCFNVVLSCITYQFIVLRRKKYNEANERSKDKDVSGGLTSIYLVGFGLIMPVCAVIPYYLIQLLGLKNKILKFFFGVQMVTAFFRCSEAIFGFLPTHVDESLYNMLAYNVFPVEAKFNSRGVMRSSWSDVVYYIKCGGLYMLLLGAYCSILTVYDYEPYRTSQGWGLLDVKLSHGFTYQQLVNNFLVAVLFQLYLTTFGYAINTATSLCGIQQHPMMLNPIFESSSPSDFWGRKWNMLVHGILKRGVYKPMRSHNFSRLVASTAAFIASGVFHEWLLSIVFFSAEDDLVGDSCIPPRCYRPGYGRNTLFFIWNAIIIGFEYAIGGAALFQLLKKHLPLILLSLLVSATALPFAHLFTNDYVRSDFFKDGQIGFPLAVIIKTS
eukprot:g11148.t1 g11148   contig5:209700-211461(+)